MTRNVHSPVSGGNQRAGLTRDRQAVGLLAANLAGDLVLQPAAGVTVRWVMRQVPPAQRTVRVMAAAVSALATSRV